MLNLRILTLLALATNGIVPILGQVWSARIVSWDNQDSMFDVPPSELKSALSERGHSVELLSLASANELRLLSIAESIETCSSIDGMDEYRLIIYSGPVAIAHRQVLLAKSRKDWISGPLPITAESVGHFSSILNNAICRSRRWLIYIEGTQCHSLDSSTLAQIDSTPNVAVIAYCKNESDPLFMPLREEISGVNPSLGGLLRRLRLRQSPLSTSLASGWSEEVPLGIAARGGSLALLNSVDTESVIQFSFVPPVANGNGFWLQTTEVPVRAFEKVMGKRRDRRLVACDKASPGDCPAVQISLGEARKFCERISGRLPAVKDWIRAVEYFQISKVAGCANLDGWVGEDHFDGLTSVYWKPLESTCAAAKGKSNVLQLHGNAAELTQSENEGYVDVVGGSFATAPKQKRPLDYVNRIELKKTGKEEERRDDVSFRCLIEASQGTRVLSPVIEASSERRVQ